MSYPKAHRMLGALILALLMLLVAQQRARAETQIFTSTLPLTYTNWSDAFVFPQFNPNLGILTSFDISSTSYMTGAFAYENKQNGVITVSGSITGSVIVDLPNSTSFLITGRVFSITTAAQPYDGRVDFAGPSSGNFAYSGTISNSVKLVNPVDLAHFVGFTTVSLPATASSSWNAQGTSANFAVSFDNFADAVAELRYHYDVPRIEFEKLVNGRLADGADDQDVPLLEPGATVTWTYLLTNTGNITIPLASITVTDSQAGITPTRVLSSDVGADQLLSPGERWEYTATATVEDLDMPTPPVTVVAGCNPNGTSAPGNRPTYRNIGTVIVPGVVVTDPAHYCNTANPGIQIVKLTNAADANLANGNDVPQISPGAAVTWTYLVTNTGNITFSLAQVVVRDSHASIVPTLVSSSDVGADQLLSPGETWRYQAVGVADYLEQPTAGSTIVSGCNPSGNAAPGTRATYENIGSVTVPGASDSDPSHYCNPPRPGIVIVKLTNGADANDANGIDVPQIKPGDTVIWSYQITNTGNITFALAEIRVTDSHTNIVPSRVVSSDIGSDALLSPGESWLYSATAPALNLEQNNPNVTTVTGCNPGGTTSGDRTAYENIGSVTVPGANDSDPSHYCNVAQPGIELVKLTNGFDANGANDADVPQVAPGGRVTWTYLITNTGQVAFLASQVVVTDSQSSVIPTRVTSSDVGADGVLSPGESWRYVATGFAENLKQPSASSTVEPGCNANHTTVPGDRPTYRNIGQVNVPGASDSDPSHYCNPPVASIRLENTVYLNYNGGTSCPGSEEQIQIPGTAVTYCFEVINNGDTYLDSFVFADPNLGITFTHLITISGSAPLAPGDSIFYYYQSAIPIGFLDNDAVITANPVDDQGRDISNLPDVSSIDPSRVGPLPTNDEETREPRRVYLPFLLTR